MKHALRVLFTAALVTWIPVVCLAVEPTTPPTPDHYVTDMQSVLSAQTQASLESELRDYESVTRHQVIVWIGATTGDEPLEEWTVDTAERWGIGRKGHDDGAVLFIFMQDHKARIEVGYGLEPYLTDAASSQIIRNVLIPKMRSGDVDGAVQDAVDRMLVTITPSFASRIGHAIATPAPGEEESGSNIGDLLAVVFIFVLVFGGLLLALFVKGIAYLVTLMTKGPTAAAKVWHNSWISSGTSHGIWMGGWMGGGGFSGGGFGGGFSAGGGGFGGGGASGGW